MVVRSQSIRHFHGMEMVPRVLSRASDLLVHLSAHPDQSLSEIASMSGLPAATCSRLLQALLALGWVDRQGERGVWRLGPLPSTLVGRAPYHARLIAVARPILVRLSRQLDAPVVLAGLVRNRRRQIILEINPKSEPQISFTEHEDLYQTATGRVILAHLSIRTRNRTIDRLGLPSARDWPGIIDRNELLTALAEIRRDNGWSGKSPVSEVSIEAVHVKTNANVPYALGTWRRFDGQDHRPILRRAAKRILESLDTCGEK